MQIRKKSLNLLSLLINLFVSAGLYAQSPVKNNSVFRIDVGTHIITTQNKATEKLKINAAPVSPPSIKYQSPQVYSINTAITELTPTNTGGAVPAAGYGQVSTFAGGRAPVTYDSKGTDAGFDLPSGIGTDNAGNVYVTDFGSGAVRKISPAADVHTITHTGSPSGLAVDNQGYIYVSDFNSNNILKITPTGVWSVFAGNGRAGKVDGKGNAASFNAPGGMTADAGNNIYVADQQNNSIRRISSDGTVKTIAGSGAAGAINAPTGLAATFNNPDGIAVDGRGNIYVADTKNNLIRKIDVTGVVTTFAGSGAPGKKDGLTNAATFNYPTGLTLDASGNLFVADYKNHAIRKITPEGQVTTIAGNGTAGNNNGDGAVARFNYPLSVAFDINGNLFVTDFANYLIRKITLTGYTIDKPLPSGLTFNPATGVISGKPTTASPATDYTINAYNASGSSSAVVNIRVSSTPLKPSVITFPPLPLANNNIIVTTATSTNTETPIIYTSSNTAVAIITPSGNIQLVGVGYATITATQAGNDSYSSATPVSQELTVYQQEVIAFAPLPVKYLNDADFDPGAKSNISAFPVTYTSSNPLVATIINGRIHIVGIGASTITALQDGDLLNRPAYPVTRELTVIPMLTFGMIPPKITCDHDFDPGAISLKPISYTSSNPAVADIVNGRIHIVSAGISIITATSNGEVLTQTLSVNQILQPAISITSDLHNPNCSGTTILFTATAVNEGANPTYSWQVNGFAAGTNSPSFSSNTLAGNDVVTCTLINNSTCAGPVSAISNPITVNILSALDPIPLVTITASTDGVSAGTPITFTADVQNTSSVNAYQWQVNGVNAGLSQSTFTGGDFYNNDVVSCIITTGNPCTAPVLSNALTVHILPPVTITVANAFTPNGDGINDTWSIPNLSFFPNSRVRVFNRYGLIVMQSTGYAKAWDGSYGGKSLPPGVYYYIIDAINGYPKLSGSVTILR